MLDTRLQLIAVEKQACISIVTAAWRWCVGVCADWPGRCVSHRSSPGPAAGNSSDSDPSPDHRQPAGLQPQPASPSHSCWDNHTVIMSRGSLACTSHLYSQVAPQVCRDLLHEQWTIQCYLWEVDMNKLSWPTWARCGGICRVHMAARWWCGVAPWGSSAATGTQGTALGQWWCRSPGPGRQARDTHTSLSRIYHKKIVTFESICCYLIPPDV